MLERRLQRMFEVSLDMLCVASAEGYFLEVNDRWTEVLGWSREELLSRPYVEFVHVDDRPSTGAQAERLDGHDVVADFENRYQHKDGGYVWLQWAARVDPETNEIVAAARPVTSSKRLRQLFSQSVDMLCVASLDGILLDLNQRWSEVLGYELEEIVGKPFWEFAHPEDVGRTIREVKRMQLSGEPSRGHFENRYRRKDGSYVWLQWTGRVDAELNELVAVARDVTEQRELADQLLQVAEELGAAHREAELANAAKDRFIANMSHELRTPLNSILGLAAVLQQTEERPDRAELLGRIHRAGRHLLAIINEVLDLAKIETGRMEMPIEEVDLDAVIAEAVDFVSVQAAEKRLRLTSEGRAGSMRANARAVRQILLNLLGNAVKFTPRGGVVLRAVSDDAGPLRVEVLDDGPGVPEEMHEEIFEAFKQVDMTTTRAHAGTGLGLHIARRLAREMGFDVTVANRPGGGACFALELRDPGAPRG